MLLLSLLLPPLLLDDAVITDVWTTMDPGRGLAGSLGAGVLSGEFGVGVSGAGATTVVGATDVVWTTTDGLLGSGLDGKETGDDDG